MHPRLFICLSVLMIFASAPIHAQRDNRHMEKGVTSVVINDKDDTDDVENVFKSNAPQAPSDNGLPRFALVGKNREFYLGLGGQFLGEGVFTWGDNMPSALCFTPASLTPSTAGSRSATQFAWQSSSLYLNFVAMPGTANHVGVFFKGAFTANNDSFSVYHFYGKYRGLTVGYTTGAFTDAAAEPMTIDYEGPNGYPYNTLFTAYWHQNLGTHWAIAAGIDAPSAQLTVNASSATVSQRIPAIPAYVQYAWAGGNAHIRLSAMLRPLQYRDVVRTTNVTILGRGIQLSGMSPVAGPLSCSFNLVYGTGIASYLQDDSGLNLDAVATTAGHLAPVSTLGITAALSVNITSSLSANLVYSRLSNHLPDNADIAADTMASLFRYDQYAATNIIYSINKFVSAGIEYDYGLRCTYPDSAPRRLHANRLQCQLAITF